MWIIQFDGKEFKKQNQDPQNTFHTYLSDLCYTVLPISFRLEGVVLVSLRCGSAGGLGADAGKGKGHWRSQEPCSPILVSLSSPGVAVQLVVSAQVGSRPSKNQGAVKHHFPPLGSGLHIKKKKKRQGFSPVTWPYFPGTFPSRFFLAFPQKIITGRVIKCDKFKGGKLHTYAWSLEALRENHTYEITIKDSLVNSVFQRRNVKTILTVPSFLHSLLHHALPGQFR